jgi:hypothetical protein
MEGVYVTDIPTMQTLKDELLFAKPEFVLVV